MRENVFRVVAIFVIFQCNFCHFQCNFCNFCQFLPQFSAGTAFCTTATPCKSMPNVIKILNSHENQSRENDNAKCVSKRFTYEFSTSTSIFSKLGSLRWYSLIANISVSNQNIWVESAFRPGCLQMGNTKHYFMFIFLTARLHLAVSKSRFFQYLNSVNCLELK